MNCSMWPLHEFTDLTDGLTDMLWWTISANSLARDAKETRKPWYQAISIIWWLWQTKKRQTCAKCDSSWWAKFARAAPRSPSSFQPLPASNDPSMWISNTPAYPTTQLGWLIHLWSQCIFIICKLCLRRVHLVYGCWQVHVTISILKFKSSQCNDYISSTSEPAPMGFHSLLASISANRPKPQPSKTCHTHIVGHTCHLRYKLRELKAVKPCRSSENGEWRLFTPETQGVAMQTEGQESDPKQRLKFNYIPVHSRPISKHAQNESKKSQGVLNIFALLAFDWHPYPWHWEPHRIPAGE